MCQKKFKHLLCSYWCCWCYTSSCDSCSCQICLHLIKCLLRKIERILPCITSEYDQKKLASNNRGKPKVRIRAKFIFIHSLNHHRLTIYMYKNFQSIIELLNHIFEIGLIKWYNVNGIVIVLDFPIDWKERFVSWGWIFYALFLGFTAFTSYT